ncbi:unnamed protein product [Cuscuta campestris]|uniref:Uncharacterized protein n=1 Tax=Cuscuta campestris TaxID=132261 RepID=A0A484M8M0_9ASTE|nr:unnamed protein product [Cuscuta campestris]
MVKRVHPALCPCSHLSPEFALPFVSFDVRFGRRGNVQAQRNWPRLVRSMLAPDDLSSLIAASVVSVTPLEGNCQ